VTELFDYTMYIYMLGAKLGFGQIWNLTGQNWNSSFDWTKLEFQDRLEFFRTELEFQF
jgi:hypothetical protein